jgi:large subunit ribosomal protein L22
VRSAIANATEQEAEADDLYVKSCWVDPGPIIKRFQPKDRGKAYAIQKKTSHLVVELEVKA